jgi:CRP-like cAMP-binding protein
MPVVQQSVVLNRLLRLLPAADFEIIAPWLKPVDLPLRTVLAEPDQPVEYAHFLDRGLGSILAISPEGQQAEVGIFGREGFCPTSLALGSDRTINFIVIQADAQGHRIERARLQDAIAKSHGLRNLLALYVQTLQYQTGFTALSNAVHPVDERLARWLLMCHDRSDGDEMALTHEFMSVMLAVRRPTVTTALHVLEGNGFISAERGYITMRNREAMERFTQDAYGKPEAEYRRLIGAMR